MSVAVEHGIAAHSSVGLTHVYRCFCGAETQITSADPAVRQYAIHGWVSSHGRHYAPPARELARSTDPATSHAAARALGGKAGSMRRAILREFSYAEMTAEEAADAAGYTPADGAWKRVSDLLNLGVIEPTGRTRPGSSGRQQRILQITALGREVLDAAA